MKTNYYQFLKLTSIFFFLVSTFYTHVVSADLPPPDASCILNFTSFPYQPTGECTTRAVDEKIAVWDSILTTHCCQNALTALSQALALQATLTQQGRLFLDENQWRNCNASFHPQRSVSMQSCGFDDLFYGSSVCSSLSVSSLEKEQPYQNAMKMCSSFDSSFDGVCRNCTTAIKEARDHILDQNKLRGNDTEYALCGVAVVTSLAASNFADRSSVEDFYRCLPAMNVFDPGYIKLNYSTVKTILAVILAVIGLMLVIILVKYAANHKPKTPTQFKYVAKWSGLYRFTKAEIETAMNFFGPEEKNLGQGCAGQVYKGRLPSGQVVAIKHIFNCNTSDCFNKEVESLSRVRHPNLVCLVGCCIEDDDQYLVYEYCSSGNLAQHLTNKKSVLTWENRVKILRGCALALRYLHNYIDGCIPHKDIKLTNILMNENLESKLSDFGLAKMLGMEETKVFTDVGGVLGYMDPEYMNNAKLTCASDVFSFGFVILQVLSGQSVLDLNLNTREQLSTKANDVRMGKSPWTDIIDPRLDGNVNSVEFESILKIAVLCVVKSSNGRPTIDDVFEEIDKAGKNTLADMRAERGMKSDGTPQYSKSMEVVAL